jgi:microsomal dipeptidase-like Zn-dependent dipeptidase
MRKLTAIVIVLFLIFVVAGFAVSPLVDSHFNKSLRKPPYRVNEAAEQLHRRLLVADLHADSLLWGRDLLARSSRGHLDIPRMEAGNVAIQAFTVVTKTPKRLNINSNTSDSDDIKRLAMVELWPPRTWDSLMERALYQAGRLNEFATKSNGEFTVLRTRGDLQLFLERRKTDPKLTAGFLGIEGAQALEGKLENLDRLHDAGYRMISPSHFFDTEIGGSSAGDKKIGLTPLGREWVRRMEAKHMTIDLAHASNATIRDVTAIAQRPVLVSHTGVKGTCDNNRNPSDDQLRAIGRTGGVVGIGFWETATCGRDAAAVARAIRHTVGVIGVNHVALGSDFDGAVTEPFDASGIALITEALMKQGFSEEEIAKIMGGMW